MIMGLKWVTGTT